MRFGVRAARLVVIAAILAPSARAQQPPANPPARPAQAKPSSPSAESMGVSLKNIRKQLDAAPPVRKASVPGMRYDFFVDVLGKRPAIEFFKDFDLSTQSGVRWGGVTHQEILNAATPLPFRSHLAGGGYDLLELTRKKK